MRRPQDFFYYSWSLSCEVGLQKNYGPLFSSFYFSILEICCPLWPPSWCSYFNYSVFVDINQNFDPYCQSRQAIWHPDKPHYWYQYRRPFDYFHFDGCYSQIRVIATDCRGLIWPSSFSFQGREIVGDDSSMLSSFSFCPSYYDGSAQEDPILLGRPPWQCRLNIYGADALELWMSYLAALPAFGSVVVRQAESVQSNAPLESPCYPLPYVAVVVQ